MSEQPFKIGQDDLFSAQVEDYLETQAQLTRSMGDIEEQSWFTKLIYANWLYLSFWCMVGALIGWGLIEPFYDDDVEGPDPPAQTAAEIFLFPTVSAFIGLFLGAAEGIMCRNLARACISGLVGVGVGMLGSLVLLIPANVVYLASVVIAIAISRNPGNGGPQGIGILIAIMGRALGWALIAIPSGIGQGIAVRERKVIINGLLGAVMGGFLGGMLFDPIGHLLRMPNDASLSRGVGFAVIGIVVGLLTGLVEGWTKTAWLLMKKGPLAGKQFILYKDTTVLGSSPKAEIYLFKDDAIEPRHVVIHNRGGRFEIEDCNTPDGTYVNGVPIKKTYLQAGDQIVLGKTVLEFALREAKN